MRSQLFSVPIIDRTISTDWWCPSSVLIFRGNPLATCDTNTSGAQITGRSLGQLDWS